VNYKQVARSDAVVRVRWICRGGGKVGQLRGKRVGSVIYRNALAYARRATPAPRRESMRPDWRKRVLEPLVSTVPVVLALVGAAVTTAVSMTVGFWVGTAQLLSFLWYQVGWAETVELGLPQLPLGQSVAVGLHSVMVIVLVIVEVEVRVTSSSTTSPAIAREAVAARMVKMLLNCILSFMLWMRYRE
jgi:hypothetical protein